jgi:hypothetical protein
MRRRAGRILIWVGVLAWVPYMVLKYYLGHDVSPLPFLTVHLLGVIPGAYLRHFGGSREETSSP